VSKKVLPNKAKFNILLIVSKFKRKREIMPELAAEVITKVKINTDLTPPKLYSVVYFNDDKTSSFFVAKSLMEVFGYSPDKAIELTSKIDKEGSAAVISGLTKEIALHLRDLVIMKARAENFPLVVEIKEEEL
jgi:ATP-dependent Clp protease adaptor protein ClpS